MADDTKNSGAGSASKQDASKIPAGIPVQEGTAVAAVADAGHAETKAAVEAAGYVLVKKNPHVAETDVLEAGDFSIGKKPVAVPAAEAKKLFTHKDKYGRQVVIKA